MVKMVEAVEGGKKCAIAKMRECANAAAGLRKGRKWMSVAVRLTRAWQVAALFLVEPGSAEPQPCQGVA